MLQIDETFEEFALQCTQQYKWVSNLGPCCEIWRDCDGNETRCAPDNCPRIGGIEWLRSVDDEASK
jgi:hypothetical protein